jgi:hypothetical protein
MPFGDCRSEPAFEISNILVVHEPPACQCSRRCAAVSTSSSSSSLSTMLLLRQFPASSTSLTPFSFPLSITPPSNSSILLSLLASIVLLSFIRAAFLCFRKNIGKQRHQQSQAPVDDKTIRVLAGTPQRLSSWASGLPTWDALPSLTLPVSFTVAETSTIGKGVGMRKKPAELPAQDWVQPVRVRRGSPAFESPRMYTSSSSKIQRADVYDSTCYISVRSPCFDGENDYVTTCMFFFLNFFSPIDTFL